jgi:hypothetical protein
MNDIGDRFQRIIEELVGNEALLEMLETEAATEMLNWGTALAATLVKRTRELQADAVELALLPRLKAVRQTMRSVGNWAAGKYVSPEDRHRLRENLLERFKVIFGEDARLPSPEELDRLLNQADGQSQTPRQLILKLRTMLESNIYGENHAKETETKPGE